MAAVWAIRLAVDGRLGASDCERLVDGALAQPVSAVTSLAYVVVGLAVAVAARRTAGRLRESVIYSLCLTAIGVGSFAFHGPQPVGSRPAHDVPIALTLAFIVVHELTALGWLRRQRLAVAGAAVASGIVGGLGPRPVVWVIGALATSAIVMTYLSHRRSRRPTPPSPIGSAPGMAGLVVLAGVTWVGGRTSSPLCDPDSAYQLHGLWHVLSALALAAWWWLAIARRPGVGAGPPDPG